MSRPAIIFPRPPPTCNTLSPAERSKLLKTTAKLGNVLGSTPHVIDDAFFEFSPSTQSLQPTTRPTKQKPRQRTWGFISRKKHGSDNSSDSGVDLPRMSTSSQSSSASSSSPSSPEPSFSTASSSERSWRVRLPGQKPPLLRLGITRKSNKTSRPHVVAPPALVESPQLPIIEISSLDESFYPSYEKEDPFATFSDSSYIELDPHVPVPTFTIPTDASLRREKMRRLRKKLGENVPVHLVFPPIAESDEEDVIIHSPTTPTSVTHFDLESSSGSYNSCSALLYSDSDQEQDDDETLPPMTFAPRAQMSMKSRHRHEVIYQIPRKSSFVFESTKPLPAIPQSPSSCSVLAPIATTTTATTRTIKRRSGQFIIHYEVSDDYAVDTFDGIKGALGGRVGVAI